MAGWRSSVARSATSSRRCGGRSRKRGPIGAGELSDGGHRAKGSLVGLERRQARPRMAVLGRRGHDCDAARLRAHLRSARARLPRCGPCRADAVPPRRRSAALLRHVDPGARASPASAACATISASSVADAKRPHSRTGRGGRPAAGHASRAGRDRSISIPRRAMPRRIEAQALALALRSDRLGADAHRATVRFPLPDRDLHAGREARVRLLLPAIPARRQHRRARSTSRPTGRPDGSSSIRSTRRRARARRRSPPALPRSSRWLAEWLGLTDIVTPAPLGDSLAALTRALPAAQSSLSCRVHGAPDLAQHRLWLRLRLNEIGPLLSLAGFGFFAWAFIALADEVREGETARFDRALLLALRDPHDLADPLGPTGSRRRRAILPGSAATRS